ncbi:hypothetical protein [Paenisporosarcina sp. NPDC076898]|uniref:hypothetical protein n=1 Tax=unclassified Paenisporosarcina TaxID=2642018 RepID=UPI003D08F073
MLEKTFINNSLATLQITLFLREGDNPSILDEASSFSLNPGETKGITYGDGEDQEIFLGGILVADIDESDSITITQHVTQRNSEFDHVLNTSTTLSINKVQTGYVISGNNIFLDAVNDAQTLVDMQFAIEDPGFGLNLTAYHALPENLKTEVDNRLLRSRPFDGYPNAENFQSSLDLAISVLPAATTPEIKKKRKSFWNFFKKTVNNCIKTFFQRQL